MLFWYWPIGSLWILVLAVKPQLTKMKLLELLEVSRHVEY
jgi:hypothetical protein